MPGKDGDWTDLFNQFLESSGCPASAKVNCERAKQKYDSDRVCSECIAGEIDERTDGTNEDDNLGGDTQLLFDMCASLQERPGVNANLRGRVFHRGLDCPWDQRKYEVNSPPIFWLASSGSHC